MKENKFRPEEIIKLDTKYKIPFKKLTDWNLEIEVNDKSPRAPYGPNRIIYCKDE